jgi:hypothetical protein
MRHLLVVVAVVGCSGKKDDKPAPEPKPVASAGSGSASAPAAPDAACVDATTKLRTWLASLTAEGSSPVMVDNAHLAKLDAEAPGPIAGAPVLFVNTKEVVFQGRLLSILPIKDSNDIQEGLAAAKATDILFVVDAAVPWPAVVATTNAAARAGNTHITFVFAAGGPGKTPPPPPSAVDKELDELAKPFDPSKPVPKLYDPKDPNRPPTVGDKIFKDCPITDAATKIGNAETSADKTAAIVEGIPAAIAACNCKVEIASVQRLLWSWYRRDSDPPMLGIGVDLAKTGTAVTAKPTAPWSDAGKLVAAAAKAGQPLAFK